MYLNEPCHIVLKILRNAYYTSILIRVQFDWKLQRVSALSVSTCIREHSDF